VKRGERSHLAAWRCSRGHVHLHGADSCPDCGGRLQAARVSADARIIATTTVRVNPTGRPFVLGLAVTRCGRARTLCVVEAGIRGNGHDPVWLLNEAGLMVARAPRVRERSPEPPATRGDWRKS
jgi:hypothetical protein